MRRIIGVLMLVLVASISTSALGYGAADQSPTKEVYTPMVAEQNPSIVAEVIAAEFYTIEVGSEIAIAQNVETVKIAGDVDIGGAAILNSYNFKLRPSNPGMKLSRYTYNRHYLTARVTNLNRIALTRRC